MEFYQELLSLETELADLRPGEGVDLGAILKNWYSKGQNLGAILKFKFKFKGVDLGAILKRKNKNFILRIKIRP